MKVAALAAMMFLGLGACALLAADKPAAAPPATQPAVPAAAATPAPAAVPVNKKCPVSGDDINPKGKTVTYKGKVIGFCCDDCIELFNKNPEKYADKIK